LTTEDLKEDSREKVQVFPDYLFVVAKEMHYKPGSNILIVVNISMIIFSTIVLTFHYEEVESLEQVLHRLKHGATVIPASDSLLASDWVLYSVLDCIVDMFEVYVSGMVIESEALDELVLVFDSEEQNDLLRRIGLSRRLLTTLRSQIRTKKELLNLLSMRHQSEKFLTKDIKLYFSDVLDNIVRMEEKLSLSKETLNNAHTTYLARVSVEVAEASNEVNFIMKKFSAVATVFIPMTLVAGLWGMNVKVPGEDTDNLGWFFGISGSIVMTSLIALYIFAKMGWL